jgi:serine/threonine-protein kinase
VVLTDFGVARAAADPSVTQVGAVIGTPRYMSPEQLSGREVDARNDLFSLGVMLYELATGVRPWNGDNPIAIAINQQTTPAKPFAAMVPPSFAAMVARCIEIDPAKRPATAAEVAAAIEHATDAPAKIATALHAVQAAKPTRTLDGTPTHITTVTTVAVLPVACGPGDEYLADGMLDDLIDTLSSSPTIRVRPAGVVRGVTEPDPRVIGRKLEVDHVVIASIRRVPAGLRIAARLINVADGFQVWVQRTECTEAEILAVSETVGRGVATALSSRATIATRPTDPRAVDLYLRARAELRRFWGNHTKIAMELLTEAAAIAPTSAPILGALAFATVQTWVMRGEIEMYPVARAAIERGLAAGHGDAYLASAIFKLNHGELEEGARELGTALVRAPMSAQAHELAGRILAETEAIDEARHHLATAVALDPGRAHLIDTDLARLEALHGDWPAALARVERLKADPDRSIAQLGAMLETRFGGWRGERAVVLSASDQVMKRVDNDGPAKLLGYIRESLHTGKLDMAEWQALAERFAAPNHPKRPQVFSFQILAEVTIVIGGPEFALAALDQAQRSGLIDVIWLDRCPLFAPLKERPEFAAIREKVAQRARGVHAALRAVTG